MRFSLACLFLALASPALAADSDRKTFHDWEAGNRLDGTSWLRSFAPGKVADGQTQPELDLLRRSDTAAYALVVVGPRALDAAKPVTLVLDGERIAVKPGGLLQRDVPEALAVQDQAALDKILPKLKNARSLGLEAEEHGGKTVKFDISLAGLAAAMLWLDDQQGQVGKPLALRPFDASINATKQDDIGYKVTVALPAQKDLPKGWRELPRVLLEKHLARGGCDPVRPDFDTTNTFEAQRLDPVITMFSISCTAGAYNFGSRFWSVKNSDYLGAEVMMFAESDSGGGFTGTDILLNPDLNPKTGILTHFAKGRGIGDCGSLGSWKWDGYGFKLEEMRAEENCNGRDSDHWPVVFKAKKK